MNPPEAMARATARPATRPRPPAEARDLAYVPAVDGFRGLAVVWIVFFHCWGALGKRLPFDDGPLKYLVSSGHFGVDLLFIISGFVLFLPAVLAHGDIGNRWVYARRRWARIVPAFWVAIPFSYLVAMSLGKVRGGPGAWVSHYTFTHQYAHHTEEIGFGMDGPMWSMSVEVIFYALLPFVAAWYARHPFTGLAGAVILSQAWHFGTVKLPALLEWADVSWKGTEDAQFRMAYAFPSYLAHFAIGMTAAWLFVRARDERFGKLPRPVYSAAALAALVGVLGLAHIRGWQDFKDLDGPFDDWVKTLDRALLFGVLILATALASERAQWLVRNGFSRLLGTVSYGIYLSHFPLIYLLMRALELDFGTKSNSDFLVLSAAAVSLSIAVGIVSYGFLEDPFRRWARRPPRTRTRTQQRARTQRRVALAGAQQW